MAEKKTNIWLMLGLGCGGLLLVIGIGTAILGYFGYQKVKVMQEDLENPLPKTMELLQAEALPPGYHANLALSIPFVMDLTMISNRPKVEGNEDPNLGDDGMMYFYLKIKDNDTDDLADYFEGKTDDATILRENNIHINSEETISRGALEVHGQKILTMVQRGAFDTGSGGGDGLQTLFFVPCDDGKLRFGIRFGPDPDPDASVEELDLTGTVVDEAQLKEFLGHFRFCKPTT